MRGIHPTGWLHHRSTVSGALAGRHDPLLRERGSSCRFWSSAHQGVDRAAARGARVTIRTARAADHVFKVGTSVPASANANGVGVDTPDGRGPRHTGAGTAADLGCRL